MTKIPIIRKSFCQYNLNLTSTLRTEIEYFVNDFTESWIENCWEDEVVIWEVWWNVLEISQGLNINISFQRTTKKTRKYKIYFRPIVDAKKRISWKHFQPFSFYFLFLFLIQITVSNECSVVCERIRSQENNSLFLYLSHYYGLQRTEALTVETLIVFLLPGKEYSLMEVIRKEFLLSLRHLPAKCVKCWKTVRINYCT